MTPAKWRSNAAVNISGTHVPHWGHLVFSSPGKAHAAQNIS